MIATIIGHFIISPSVKRKRSLCFSFIEDVASLCILNFLKMEHSIFWPGYEENLYFTLGCFENVEVSVGRSIWHPSFERSKKLFSRFWILISFYYFADQDFIAVVPFFKCFIFIFFPLDRENVGGGGEVDVEQTKQWNFVSIIFERVVFLGLCIVVTVLFLKD